jgi:hypothetical protein
MAFQALEFLQGKMGSESQATALHPNIGQEIGRVKRPLSAMPAFRPAKTAAVAIHLLQSLLPRADEATFIGFTQVQISPLECPTYA